MEETIVAWIAGTVLSVIGWGSLVHFSWIVRNWPKARGRVVGNIAEWSRASPAGHGKRTVYFPEIEFDTPKGLHVARGGSGLSKEWDMGHPVELHYSPANPDHLLDLNLAQRLLFSGAFILLGAACLAAALGWVS